MNIEGAAKLDELIKFIKENEPALIVKELISKGYPINKGFFEHYLFMIQDGISKAENIIMLKELKKDNDHNYEVLHEPDFTKSTSKNKKLLSDVASESWSVSELEVTYKTKNTCKVQVRSSESAYNVFKEMWDNSLINIQEQLCVLFLNRQGFVVGFRLISTGNSCTSTVDVKLIISCALLCRAESVILAHNHPSGNLEASKADIELTSFIKKNLSVFNITLSDHLIISEYGYSSFEDSSIMKRL